MSSSLFGVDNILNADVSGTLVPQSFIGTAGQVLFNITNFTYTPITNSILVYINGTLQISGRDYNETSSTSFTLLEGVVVGDFIDVIGFPALTLTAVPGTPNINSAVILNIAALRASSISFLPNLTTKGYYTSGDGGHGSYYLDLTDTTSTDNGGTIIVAADGGRWKLLMYSVVNVKQFGAKADGNTVTGAGTDNTTFFQNAITALTGTTNCLYVPGGIYILHSQITVPSSFTLSGAGNWVTILCTISSFNDPTGLIRLSGSGGPATVISDLVIAAQNGGAGGSSAGYYSAANGTIGKNLWITGFFSNVVLANSDNFFLDSLTEQAVAGGSGMNILSGEITVANCEVYNCYVGLNVTNTYVSGTVTLTGIRSLACASVGFSLINANNVQMANCSVGHNNTGSYQNGGINSTGSNNIAVSNFIARLGGGISTTGAGMLFTNGSKVNISNSQCSAFLDGIQFSGVSQASVSGNSCSDNGRYGINVQGGDRVVVNGNVCASNGTVGSAVDAGIVLNNTGAFSIMSATGNICTQNGGGNQDYGINANVTINNSFINLTGNLNKFNNVAQILTTGITANIQSTGNL